MAGDPKDAELTHEEAKVDEPKGLVEEENNGVSDIRR